jgi:hypothetical protein
MLKAISDPVHGWYKMGLTIPAATCALNQPIGDLIVDYAKRAMKKDHLADVDLQEFRVGLTEVIEARKEEFSKDVEIRLVLKDGRIHGRVNTECSAAGALSWQFSIGKGASDLGGV